MALEDALYTRLTGHAGTAALVGTRVYPNVLPQGVTFPCVSYRRVSGVREHAMGADPQNVESTVQVDCWATTYAGVKALYTQVFQALTRYRLAGTFDDVFAGVPQDLYESEKDLHRVRIDFTVYHREAAA